MNEAGENVRKKVAQTQSVPAGCKAKTLQGDKCRNPAKKGKQFCWLHSLSRRENAHWWENTLVQVSIIGLAIVGVLVTVYYGQTGATKDLQIEQIQKQDSQIAQADFIKGTRVTYSTLDNTFPFGWVVFFLNQGERKTYEVDPAGRLKYKINWSDVVIEPNQLNRTVKWTIPNLGASGGSLNTSGSGNRIIHECPMLDDLDFNYIVSEIVFDPNEPKICIRTLSNDQRKPVFVLGFRIVGANETTRKTPNGK